jgi:6-phosphogluconolactonase
MNGRFSVALSGGSTPRPMNRLLATEPYASQIPWQDTHIFMVDERMLPFEDPQSNFGALKADLLAKVPAVEGQIHPMPVWLEPAAAAAAYIRQLEVFFGNSSLKAPVFDLILLGIGSDGHTASLFPEVMAGLPAAPWVLAVRGGSPAVWRLTLNVTVLNQARHVCFLASGPEKSNIVRELFAESTPLLPAQMIAPAAGSLTFILDRTAAARLPESNR